MNLLAPLFLLGAAAIAGPIFFHLIRRTTRDRIPFPTLLFLQPTPPRITRRSRLHDILLLALRILALLLVVLAFSRPYLQRPSPPPPPDANSSRTVLLLDTSASMRRSGLWTDALQKASQHIRNAGPNDQLALVAFDRSPRTLVSFQQWSETPPNNRAALALATLQSLAPSWHATALGPALIRAAEELSEGDSPNHGLRRRILLVSDLQDGARMDPIQSFEWPRNVELLPDPVRPSRPGNAGIQWLPEPPDADRADAPVTRVRIINSPDAPFERFRVAWAASDDGPPLTTPLDVYVPPGQSRVVALGNPTNSPTADRIVLTGDTEPFDNILHVSPPQPVEIPVAYIGDDSKGEPREPLFFLQRALPESRRALTRLSVFPPQSAPSPELLRNARLVVLTAPLPDPVAHSLHQAVSQGTTLVFAPASALAGPTLARLTGQPSLALAETKPDKHALLASLDFRHPLLAPFNDPRFSDFTRIHWWRYRRLSGQLPPSAKVVARFDSGDPAWIDFPVGAGRVVFLASSWSVADSQFALSSKFIPWLFGVLDMAGASLETPLQPKVGDPIPLPANRAAPLTVRRPDGSSITLPTDATQLTDTPMPGTYLLGDSLRVGVQIDPSESRTAPLPPDRLESLGVRMDPALSSEASMTDSPKGIPPAAEAESRQKFWRWLVVAALVVLVVESFLAGIKARVPASPNPADATPVPASP